MNTSTVLDPQILLSKFESTEFCIDEMEKNLRSVNLD